MLTSRAVYGSPEERLAHSASTDLYHFYGIPVWGIAGATDSRCLERMNELQFFSADDPDYSQGFRTILATEPVHPYVANWWPPGHIIGYEHEFIHSVVDFLNAIGKREKTEPNFFYDGMKAMQVLEAGLESAREGKKITLG